MAKSALVTTVWAYTRRRHRSSIHHPSDLNIGGNMASREPDRRVNFAAERVGSIDQGPGDSNEEDIRPTDETRYQSWKRRIREYFERRFADADFVIDPEGDKIYVWMGLVTFAVLYNVWMIILRIAFKEMREDIVNRRVFGTVDFASDIIFSLDILVNFRIAFLDQGLLVKDPRRLSSHYRKSIRFKLDILAMIPLGTMALLLGELADKDVFNVQFDVDSDNILIPVLRLPRLLKWHTMESFTAMSDTRTSNPNRVRAFKLIMYLGVIIHWIGCFYYMLSEVEGFGSNEWVYPADEATQGLLRKYILCIYWSMMTLTTIGETNPPYNDIEYVFTGITFLVGVFLFAAVVGNVGDVISNMNAARQEFTTKMDAIKFYMNHRKVPDVLQTRVKKWSDYAWSRTQALDDQTFLEILPPRLRAEIAIHVHLETLKKVKIFEDCEQGLLCELVLKLRSQIFSPGDYICRRGEIGREMYIINHGKVQVVVQDAETQQSMVVATLSEGNYFGEISLLKLDEGQNRRTADVVSLGYSELLCLSKKDLMQALVEYPDAKKVLEKHGRDRMEKNREAARMQRRKSEATLQVPGQDQLQKSPDDKAGGNNSEPAEGNGRPETGGPAGEIGLRAQIELISKLAMKGKEMSELRHIINELRNFDSMSTKAKIHELSHKCDELWKKLRQKDLDLKRALRRISELESRVTTGINGVGRAPRRFGQALVKRSKSLHLSTYDYSSVDDHESSLWASSLDSADGSANGYTPTNGMSNGHGPRGNLADKHRTPSTTDRSPEHSPRRDKYMKEMIVPGIQVNGMVKQEPLTMKWEVFADEEQSDQANDSEIEKTMSQLQPAIASLTLPSSGRGSGAISDVSCYSDASLDSDL
ncbi:cyclic nucleotide-gated channel rod photoreceptor subunit alpha-like isoform X1 [Acanthaster planci]|uniref:Cyclic nucleotide-gated channel rod photoreceptor subunit alpha-like isoform X1 n=2 Tax=Acanthaster planci TaxID=133434 RepID=A0A8B7Y3A4_ACAPL|nr:cyclic nucleotide-gated channel rod photoreceptor subunit alpha-like isoform X1 [Acanthaster planci]